MQRRELFRAMMGYAGGGLLPLSGAACGRPLTRDDVLAGIIEHIAVPDVASVAKESLALRASLTALSEQPSANTLDRARDAWRTAAVTWRHAGAFRQGPLVATSAVVRATFWPPRAAAVEQLMGETTPVDAAYVKGLGVDLKGIYGLEAFLFPQESDAARVAALFSDPTQVRRGQLVQALADNVVMLAEDVKRTLGDGKASAANFALGGQAHLNQLVSEMIATVDNVASKRLDAVIVAGQNGTLESADVEGAPGGVSHLLVQRELDTVSRLYSGASNGGVSALVRSSAPDIDSRVKERLRAVLDEADALNRPIERLAHEEPEKLVRTRDAAKALDLALKVDVASALGLTLSFQAGDAD